MNIITIGEYCGHKRQMLKYFLWNYVPKHVLQSLMLSCMIIFYHDVCLYDIECERKLKLEVVRLQGVVPEIRKSILGWMIRNKKNGCYY